MMEILTFIFSSFWIWLGTVILVLAVFEGIGFVLRGASGNTISEKKFKKQVKAILENRKEE